MKSDRLAQSGRQPWEPLKNLIRQSKHGRQGGVAVLYRDWNQDAWDYIDGLAVAQEAELEVEAERLERMENKHYRKGR